MRVTEKQVMALFQKHPELLTQYGEKPSDNRTQLPASVTLKGIQTTINWLLDNIEKIKTPNKIIRKAIVEEEIGYINNTTLVTAALLAGYSYKQDERGYFLFGMSEKSWRKVVKIVNQKSSSKYL